MRKVFKMAGIAVATIAVLTVLVSTVAMAGNGQGDGSGICINSECPCNGDQTMNQYKDCLGDGQGDCTMNQNQGETCAYGDCLCEGCQLQQKLQLQDGEGDCTMNQNRGENSQFQNQVRTGDAVVAPCGNCDCSQIQTQTANPCGEQSQTQTKSQSGKN